MFSTWFNTWFNVGFSWNNQLKAPTKQQKFPWLNAEQIKRLESLTSDPQEQQQLYKQAIQQLNDQNYNENRIATENEMQYKSLNTKDTQQKNYMQSSVRLEQLADLTKKKFWLNADADTQSVINWLMQYATDKGVTMDTLNDYLAWYNEKFLYETWLKEESTMHKIWQVVIDIGGWAYDSVTGLPKFLAKWAANAIGWTAKQFGADEEKTDALVQSYKDFLDNEMSSKDIWADQESLTYNISKGVSDVTQVLAGEWLLKWAVQWTAKWWQLLNYMKNAPTWQKMVAWWIEWAGDMTLYSIVSESRLPTEEELALWGGLWALIPWAWAVLKASRKVVNKWLEKVAQKLELNSLLNPQKLEKVKNQLIQEWVDLGKSWMWKAEAWDVGQRMLDRWFQWDKETIVKQLNEHSDKAYNIKRELLGQVTDTYESKSWREALEIVRNDLASAPWNEKALERIDELLAKDKYTLTELDDIKRILDTNEDLYTVVWEAKTWAKKKWMINIRRELKKQIEDLAEEQGLGNIKMLNNEIQVSKSLAEWIAKKDNADKVREMVGIFSRGTIWWALGGQWVWPFDSNTTMGKIWNIAFGAFVWSKMNTKNLSRVANRLNKANGWVKKELEQYIYGWVKELTPEAEKTLSDIVTKLKPKATNEEKKIFIESLFGVLKGNEWVVIEAWKDIMWKE